MPPGVLGFNEPDGFRGLPWGASEQAAATKIDKDFCEAYPDNERFRGDRWCVQAFELGAIRISAIYKFRRNHFVRVDLRFESNRFAEVLSIFVERYGRPTSEQRQMVQNRMGAQFENHIVTWEGPKIVINAQRYGADLNEGSATLQTQEELKEGTRLYQNQLKGAGKGLWRIRSSPPSQSVGARRAHGHGMGRDESNHGG